MRVALRRLLLACAGTLLLIGLFPGWSVVQTPGNTLRQVTAGLPWSPLALWEQRSFDPGWVEAEIRAGRSVEAGAGMSFGVHLVSWSALAVAVGVALLRLLALSSRPEENSRLGKPVTEDGPGEQLNRG